MFPDYAELDILKYSRIFGVYTLGMAQYHRPDLAIVHDHDQLNQDQTFISGYYSPAQIQNLIEKNLKKNLTVCLCITDVDFMWPPNSDMVEMLNSYKDHPVYLITQLDPESQKVYTFQHGLQIKMLELPWELLNECLCYYRARAKRKIKPCEYGVENFVCMINNKNSFKQQLLECLVETDLHNKGLLTVMDYKEFGESTTEQMNFLQTHCKISKLPVFHNFLTALVRDPNFATRSCIEIDYTGLLVSYNVANYLLIERFYKDIPMVVHPESTGGIFISTEKSLWPLLLGKLMLVAGRPGVMSYMQRFYDVDFSSLFDLSFDSMGGYDLSDHRARITAMLNNNKEVILNADQVHQAHAEQLESARWTLGKNMYEFFCRQLESIPVR
jgi:hypothetical protein